MWIDGDVTTAGVPIDVTGVRLVGLNTITPTITVTSGTIFSDSYYDYYFENVAFSFGGTAPVIDIPFPGGTITLGPYASIVPTNTATAGFIQTTEGSIYFDCTHDNTIGGGAGHQAIKLLGTNPQLILRIGNFCTLAANTITGGPPAAATITDLSKPAPSSAHATINAQAGLDSPIFD